MYYLFLFTVLLLNSFIVEPRNNEIHSAREKSKMTRRALLVQRYDPEHGRWRDDSSTVTIVCQRNSTMMISGNFVKLSDIPPKPDRNCNGTKANIIELFATEKVILDEDFIESGEEFTLVIIAPRWEVVGHRKIVLDGSHGEEHHQTKAEIGSDQKEYDGANGKPGLPGGRGGNFYGIGKTLLNADKLFISANGGNGGSGQDGGDGADGIDAPTYQFEGSLDEFDDSQYRVESTSNNFDPLGTTTTHYVVHGLNGTIGGKGGDGGCGGNGGIRGEILISSLNETGSSFVMVSMSDGLVGPGGDGGKGGKGGCNARSVKFTHQNIHSWSYFSSAEEIDNGSARDGENGVANENRLGIKLLNGFYPSLNIQSAISDFKFFAMWYLLDSKDDEKFREFYYVLLNDKSVGNWSTVSGFQVEAFYIEQLYSYSKNWDLLLPFVKFLNQRIGTYLTDQKSDKKFLQIINSIESMELQVRIGTIEASQKISSKFDNHLDVGFKSPDLEDIFLKFYYYEKIEQQMKLVKSYFTKVSSILGEEIEGKIDEVIRESNGKIERLIRQSSSSKHITKGRKELNKELVTRFALENIRFLSLVLQLANIKIYENCMLKYESRYHLFDDTKFAQFIFPRNVQETYKEIQTKYKNYINKRIAIIKNHLYFVEEQKQFASYEEKIALNNLSKDLGKLILKIKYSNLLGTDPFLMEEDILSKVENSFYYLRKGSSNNNLFIKVIKHLKLQSLLGETFGDSYKRFKNVKGAFGMKNIFTDFRKHFAYDKLHEIRGHISKEVFSKFDENWIRMEMIGDEKEATQEFNFAELKWYFHSFDIPFFYGNYMSIINFTIPIKYLEEMQYQSLEEKKFPLDYEKTLLICYEQYNEQNNYYDEIVTQYRQFIFPWGKKDMQYLTEHLEKKTNSKEDWKDVLKNADIFDTNLDTSPKEKLKSLDKRIQSFINFSSRIINQTKLLKGSRNDKFMNCDKDNVECPFLYNWGNKLHKKEIGDLLSGEEVTLESVIEPESLSGVKFGEVVGIQFRSNNKTLQEELAKILKGNFYVSLKHHGDSHYKCEHDVYLIRSKMYSCTFYFNSSSFWSRSHLEKFLLSPYATWTMQINCENCGEYFNAGINDLKKYEDFVDIALIGEIYYLDDAQIRYSCDDDLQKYYEREGDPVEPKFVRNFLRKV